MAAMPRRSLLLVALLAGLAPAAAEESTGAWLGYRWERVESAQYRVTLVEETLAIREGKSLPSRTETESTLTITPRGQEGERVSLDVRFDRVRLSADPQGVEVDSAAAENARAGPLAAAPAVLAAVREIPLRVVLSPGGRVLEVGGMAAFLAAARGAMPESPNRDALLRYLLPLNDAEVADRVGAIAFPLPNRSVEAGAEMEVRLPVPGISTPLDSTVRFDGVLDAEGGKIARVFRTLAAENLPPAVVTDGDRHVTVTTTRVSIETTLDLSLEAGIPVRQTSLAISAQEIRQDGGGGNAASIVEKNLRLEAVLLHHEDVPAPAAPGHGGS